MVDYNSDEERFTAIVDFLKRNKKSILLTFSAIFFVAISSVSISAYQDTKNAKASALYDVWFAGNAADTPELKKITNAFTSLQENFSNTGYAGLARVIKGSQFARDGDLDLSLQEFSELLDSTSGLFGNDVLNSIARINIARIELVNKNYSKALEALEPLNSNSEHSMVYEVMGDALAGLNKKELALAQYNLALLNMQDESQQSLLNMKINYLTQ